MSWHEEDQFWISMRDKLFSSDSWEGAVQDISAIEKLTGINAPAQVLDMPCGPGRHALELASRGYPVTGVDRTKHYLDEAKYKAAEENLEIEWVHDDMRDFHRLNYFDMVINLYTSFGYFEDPAEDMTAAQNFHLSLKPGGKLIMEMMGKEVLARIFSPRDWYEEEGVVYLEEREVTRDWTWVENRWVAIKDNQRFDYKFSHRVYSGQELKDLLLSVGFDRVLLYGGLDGQPYDNEAIRLVVVAVK
ncbi:MAG: class I SAM-dependent methyltransferase [Spirochaetales bacterium]|nr:class I SAM-dependent methyltransferase [Spirochaetales bacterium]